MKTKTFLSFLFTVIFFGSTIIGVHAQVAINNSAANPDASAILDLNTGNGGVNKGFLAPQVALTDVTVAMPVVTPAPGLMVYSSTAPTGGNGIGYYYWNGSIWASLNNTGSGITSISAGTSGVNSGGGLTFNPNPITSTGTIAIANTGVSAGTYGNNLGSSYPYITVNAQGQLTSVSSVPITASSIGLQNLTPSTGLSGSVYNGSVAVSDWAVIYGSSGGTAVQGNTTFTISPGTGLSGGMTITEGAGGTATLNIAPTGVSAGLYGDASHVATFNVNLQGQLTTASNVAITPTSIGMQNLTPGAGLTGSLYNGSSAVSNWAVSYGSSANTAVMGNTQFTINAGTGLSVSGVPIIEGNGGTITLTNTGVTSVSASNPLFSSGGSTPTISLTGIVPIANGGTGISSIPGNGQLLIGNGSGYSLNNISAGAGISITNNPGSIIISSSGSSLSGSGINNYVARWTPNSTTLGYGLIQDNGSTGVGINAAPNSGDGMLYCAAGSGLAAIYGDGLSTSIGVEGYANANGHSGVHGTSTNASSWGVDGYNASSNGTGVLGAGNNILGTYLLYGSGGAFTGYNYGLAAYFTNTFPTQAAAFYGADPSNTYYASVAFYNGSTNYKIIGTGSVSTIVSDINGAKVVLHCPETPEYYFEDYGQGQLVNGKAHIDIDPTLAKNVAINEKHPLRVFIQLEDNENCKGVIVKNKTNTGFDIVEMNGGTSNTPFQWHIICNVKDANDKGYVSKFADLRFEPAPKPVESKQSTVAVSNPVQHKK